MAHGSTEPLPKVNLIGQGYRPSPPHSDPVPDSKTKSHIYDFEGQANTLFRERETFLQTIHKLEDENRKLIEIAAKLASAFDRQASIGVEVGMTALVWDLRRSQRDLASEREMASAQWRIIEDQAYRIAMQEREIAQLRGNFVPGN